MGDVTSLDAVCGVLAGLAPLRLAESWDNVGLLVGDRQGTVHRIMTCLTITPNVVDEAVAERADLIITHHPLPFKPLSRITTDNVVGSMLLRLIGSGIAVYSAHTAFDSAAGGINETWGTLLGLENVRPLVDVELPSGLDRQPVAGTAESEVLLGSGRYGELREPIALGVFVRQAAQLVDSTCPRLVGSAERVVRKVALACGSGGTFLPAAARRGCDVMMTGEATFHTCLEAEARDIGLGLLGHFSSERFAMERLATTLTQEFSDISVWPSGSERDPVKPL